MTWNHPLIFLFEIEFDLKENIFFFFKRKGIALSKELDKLGDQEIRDVAGQIMVRQCLITKSRTGQTGTYRCLFVCVW